MMLSLLHNLSVANKYCKDVRLYMYVGVTASAYYEWKLTHTIAKANSAWRKVETLTLRTSETIYVNIWCVTSTSSIGQNIAETSEFLNFCKSGVSFVLACICMQKVTGTSVRVKSCNAYKTVGKTRKNLFSIHALWKE